MPDQQNQTHSRKRRFLPTIIVLIIMGLAVHLLIPQITSLEHSISILKQMTWWAVILAFIAQILSYLASGYALQALLQINHEKLSITKGALITMASGSVGMVAGGWVGGAAATYTWLKSENQGGKSAVLAGTLPSLLNNSVLTSLALIGTGYLLLVHDLTNTQMVEFSIILVMLGILAAGIIGMLRSPERTIRIAKWFPEQWAKIRHKQFDPEKFENSIRQLLSAWNLLQNSKWVKPLLGAAASILFDLLTLYFMFVAAGHNVNIEVLIAGYGLPLLLGKMAFIFPGGVGVIEGSMVALYTSLKVPNAISVVVILGYRLISFWLPTILGFIAATYLSRKSRQTFTE